MLEFLAAKTNFNFNIEDRWGKKVLDELKNQEQKSLIEHILAQRSNRKISK